MNNSKRDTGFITLQAIIDAQKTHKQIRLPVVGYCMERLNILDGGTVAIDFTRYPRPHKHDACICYAKFPGQLEKRIYIKEYLGVWGRYQNVGTAYKDKINCAFFADAIFGVVFAAWDKEGNLLWENDPDIYLTELHTKPTIHGDNIGNPNEI